MLFLNLTDTSKKKFHISGNIANLAPKFLKITLYPVSSAYTWGRFSIGERKKLKFDTFPDRAEAVLTNGLYY